MYTITEAAKFPETNWYPHRCHQSLLDKEQKEE
jgi:hypothetical protein